MGVNCKLISWAAALVSIQIFRLAERVGLCSGVGSSGVRDEGRRGLGVALCLLGCPHSFQHSCFPSFSSHARKTQGFLHGPHHHCCSPEFHGARARSWRQELTWRVLHALPHRSLLCSLSSAFGMVLFRIVCFIVVFSRVRHPMESYSITPQNQS